MSDIDFERSTNSQFLREVADAIYTGKIKDLDQYHYGRLYRLAKEASVSSDSIISGKLEEETFQLISKLKKIQSEGITIRSSTLIEKISICFGDEILESIGRIENILIHK